MTELKTAKDVWALYRCSAENDKIRNWASADIRKLLAAIDAAETALAAEQAKLTHYTTCVLVNARQCVEIDTLKEQLAEANATIERLSAPVSDEEMRAHSVKIHNQEGQHAWLLDRGMVDALNAARKAAQ